MVKKSRSKRKVATRVRRQGAPKSDAASKESLEGLRDALDLTLTRVIEDDMGVEEARAVLRYLEKELDGFEQRTEAGSKSTHKVQRRTGVTRKSKRAGGR